MTRRLVVIAALATVSAVLAVPAFAGVGNNPNAEFIADVACEDGTEAELVIATGQAGHSQAGALVGVATSIWILDGPNGTPLFPIFDRPGGGLDNLTTWCWWFDSSEGAWIGADILARS